MQRKTNRRARVLHCAVCETLENRAYLEAPGLGDGIQQEWTYEGNVVLYIVAKDPDGGHVTNVHVDWGDGQTTDTTEAEAYDPEWGDFYYVSNAYADNGDPYYHATITLTDDQGETSDPIPYDVLVNNYAPTADISRDGQVTDGSSVMVSLDNVQDTGQADIDAGFHYSFGVNESDLADTYDAASDNPSKTFTPQQLEDEEDGKLWARVFDKDSGFRTYDTDLSFPPVDVSTVSTSQINLNWTAMPGNSAGYEIQWKTTGTSFVPLISITDPTVLASITNGDTLTWSVTTGLQQGKKYWFRVRALGGDPDQQNYSPKRAATTMLPAPSNLTYSTNGTDVTLSWHNNAGDSDFVVAVEEQTSASEVPEYAEIAQSAQGASSIVLHNVLWVDGLNYDFRVRATNDGGASDYSNEIHTSVPMNVPTLTSAAQTGPHQVHLQWTDNSLSEQEYEIWRSEDGGGHWVQVGSANANATSWDDTTVLDGTSDVYRIKGVNFGSFQNSALSQPVDVPLLGPTQQSAAALSGNSVQVTWNDNSNNEDGYQVYRFDYSTFQWVIAGTKPANATSFVDSGLDDMTTYLYYVQAYKAADRAASGYATATTPLAAPSDVSASEISGGMVLLNWANNSSHEDGYVVFYSTDGTNWNPIATTGPNITSTEFPLPTWDALPMFQVQTIQGDPADPTNSSTVSTTVPVLPVTPTVDKDASHGSLSADGKSMLLSVQGDSPHGTDGLTYTWSATPTDAPDPVFSNNGTSGAEESTATFFKAGHYDLTVTIDNYGATKTSSVGVDVDQLDTSIVVSPGSVNVAFGATQPFAAAASDQFGDAMITPPSFTWSVVGDGNITNDGAYTAPNSAGWAIIKVIDGDTTGIATVAIDTEPNTYKVTITGRAYEPGYDSSKSSGDLTVTNSGWISANSPEDAVAQAVSGSVTLNTVYNHGHDTLMFPRDLGSVYGFAILATTSEGAAAHLTLDAANSRYTGAIGMWDGDSGAPRDWDFYWTVQVQFQPAQLYALVVQDHSKAANYVETDSSSTSPDLFVAQDANNQATIDLSGIFAPADAKNKVHWQITRSDGAAAGSGDFSGGTKQTKTVTATDGARDFTIVAWLDDNNNGVKDGGEDSRTVNVHVVQSVSVQWVSDANEAAGTIQFKVQRNSLQGALTVQLETKGTATSGTDYTAIPASVTIPAGQGETVVTITPIQDTQVEFSETVDLWIKPDNAYLIAALKFPGDAVLRLRHKQGMARAYLDDDDVGPMAGRTYPAGTQMNPLATDNTAAAANSPDNCQSWAFNSTGFSSRPTEIALATPYATKHGLFDAGDTVTKDDILSDAAMMKRVLESMFYDDASPVQGYRCYFNTAIPFNTTTLIGSHMITAYWRNTILGHDYHYNTKDFDPAAGTWDWSDKESSAKVAGGLDPYSESGTFLSHYIISTAPRDARARP